MARQYRLDDLAREAGVASTTVRLYQAKGLLARPRLEGRTGWYDDTHLGRLRLIARLQARGYSLAGIANLLGQWEHGRSLEAVIGVDADVEARAGNAHAVVLPVDEVRARFPAGSMTGPMLERAAALGLLQLTGDAEVRVADRRFLEAGTALAHLGLPVSVVLDEWEELVAHTDDVASRFLRLCERYQAPRNRRRSADPDMSRAMAEALARLEEATRQMLAAAVDASFVRLARERLPG